MKVPEQSVLRPTGAFILETALHHLAARQRTSESRLQSHLRKGDPGLHAQFRLVTARMLYMALDPGQKELRSMHVFGSSVGDEARPTSDIDLLVHVEDPNGRLVRKLHELGEELSQAYREMMATRLPEAFALLSVHVVTDEQVRQRTGLASVITSLHLERYRLGPPTASQAISD